MEGAHSPQHVESATGLLIQSKTDDCHINRVPTRRFQQFLGTGRGRDHMKSAITFHRVSQQLRVNTGRVCNRDAD
jgi:hypothetical protein